MQSTTEYGFAVRLNVPYDEAVRQVTAALKEEGFGVLTEIDVQATLREKLDVDFRPYVILGACNPPLAHQALTAERDIGLLLPCNVIVYAGDTPNTSVVAALDPVAQLNLAGRKDLLPVAQDVRARMERVVAAITRPA